MTKARDRGRRPSERFSARFITERRSCGPPVHLGTSHTCSGENESPPQPKKARGKSAFHSRKPGLRTTMEYFSGTYDFRPGPTGRMSRESPVPGGMDTESRYPGAETHSVAPPAGARSEPTLRATTVSALGIRQSMNLF